MKAAWIFLKTNTLQDWAGWLAFLLPLGLVLGNAPADMMATLIGVLFLTEKMRARDFAWAKTPWFMAGLCLWFYSSIRGLVADNKAESFYYAFVWVRFLLLGAALAFWILPLAIWRRRLCQMLLVTTLFLSLDAMFQYIFGFDIIGRQPTTAGRLTSSFSRPIVGVTIANLFFPVLGYFVERKRFVEGAFYAGVCLVAILFSGERMAFLLGLCGICAFSFLSFRHRSSFRWYAVGIVVTIACLVMANPSIYQRQVDQTSTLIENFTVSHYGSIWESAWNIALKNPAFGVGIHHFRDACPDAQYGPLYSAQGMPRCALHAHNNYLEWLSEGGLIGLALFISLLIGMAISWKRGYPVNKGNAVFLLSGAYLCVRFLPIVPLTSFFNNWAAIPLWMMIGFAMSYGYRTRIDTFET